MNRNDLFEGYVSLTHDMIHAKRVRKSRSLTVGMYVKGEQYHVQEKRLLVIGRALNGWDAEDIVWETGATDISPSEKAMQILRHWHNQETCPNWNGKTDRFYDRARTKPVPESDCIALEWIHSYYRGDDAHGLIKTSELPFWRYAGIIAQALLDTRDNSWSKKIAWTNLYKVAPAKEGNPSDALCNKQLPSCRQILEEELRILKPTHILVIARTRHRGNIIDPPDTDYWTKNFHDILKNYQDGENRPVYISYAARPEFASKEQFDAMIEQTKKDFALLN